MADGANDITGAFHQPIITARGAIGAVVGVGVNAAVGNPKPRPPRGRPGGNGALGPVTPRPGLGGFGGRKPKRSQITA